MVHDWFVHARSKTEFIDIPTPPGDDYGEPSVRVPRSVPDPAPAGSKRPPAYANLNSHWWDASQIYGADAGDGGESCGRRSAASSGIEPTGLLPTDPETGLSFTGFTDNWWIGLAMLHTLFTQEHNYLCDLLAHEHPDWNDDQLFGQCTADQLRADGEDPHRRVDACDRAAPDHREGHAGRLERASPARSSRTRCSSSTTRRSRAASSDRRRIITAAPYSLTEEFVAVYRMHPLIPDEVAFHSLATGGLVEKQPLTELAGRKTPAIAERLTMPDLFYSFGTCHPGAVTLHNYPRTLQNLRRDDGEHLDLAAVDILRDRERGVPRYNQFRRLLHKEPVKSFDELTDNAEWRRQIKEVYNNDLESVDLMTGLYAEPLPAGFGFSETAFRIFLLMASRRLKSDRFFTDDYRAEVYGEFGLDYIRKNTMLERADAGITRSSRRHWRA